jgi:hypothetical protein
MPKNLKEGFRKQIFDIEKGDKQCTGSKYVDYVTSDKEYLMLNKEAIDKKINRKINERYNIYGFLEFANLVKKMDGSRYASKIKENFSNRVIIIDEVHNVREVDNIEKKVPPVILSVIKHAVNVKLVLLSATPMFNEASEIMWIINLLLANDKREMIDPEAVFHKGELTNVGSAILESAATGYVSYMRGENPFTFPMKLYSKTKKYNAPMIDVKGVDIPTESRLSVIPIVASELSDFQKEVYLNKEHEVAGYGHDKEDNEMKISNAQHALREVSNIVFAKGTHGNSGFDACFDKTVQGKALTVKYNGSIEFLDQDNLRKHSAKISSIIDSVKSSTGIVFVYSFYLQSGIVPTAIALEHLGFKKYGSVNILNSKTRIPPFMINGKQASYIILSPNKLYTNDFNEELAVAKSAANVDGEIIKVILGSSVAAEGIDFKNIREIHILEPWYHLNKIEQVVGRAVRHCSHLLLPEEKRNVTVFHHASTIKGRSIETVDERAYTIAERKQLAITKVETILKRVAIDCNFNQEALFFEKHKGTKVVDSQNKTHNAVRLDDTIRHSKYKCARPLSENDIKMDFSTNVTTIEDEELTILVKMIGELFTTRTSMTFVDIVTALQSTGFQQSTIMYALDEMDKNKIPINEGRGYLIYRSDVYIYQPTASSDTLLSIGDRTVDKIPQRKIMVIPKNFDTADDQNEDAFLNRINSVLSLDFGVSQMPGEVAIKSALYDYIIDRMFFAELKALCEYIFIKKVNIVDRKLICDSLRDGYVTIQNGDFIRDIYTKTYWVLNGDAYVLASANVVEKNKVHLEKNMPDTSIMIQKFKGFIAYEVSKGTPVLRFKLIDESKERSTGYICSITSTLQTKQLQALIETFSPNSFITPDTLMGKTKPILCNMYEILLRLGDRAMFGRTFDAINARRK